MQGLHQDPPLLLSSILEHAAANHADVALLSHSGAEITRTDYARIAARTRQLASALRIHQNPRTLQIMRTVPPRRKQEVAFEQRLAGAKLCQHVIVLHD